MKKIAISALCFIFVFFMGLTTGHTVQAGYAEDCWNAGGTWAQEDSGDPAHPWNVCYCGEERFNPSYSVCMGGKIYARLD